MTQRVVNYTYGTGNPVLPDGSKDVRDGIDNLQSFDIFMNADEDTYNQRDGEIVKTRAGAVRDVGIQRVGDFTAGCTVTQRNHGVLYETDGTVYVWLGALPKVVPPSSSPATTGGIGPSAWLDVGDASAYTRIINEFAAPNGVDLVGGAAKQADLVFLSNEFSASLYQKYYRADEYAKLLQDSGGVPPFSIDCFGDSTMWGATSTNVPVQDPNNPPSVLRTTIANLYGCVVTVTNRAISGTTMGEMLAGTDGSGSTFESKIATTSASVIYCNHCINDSQLNKPIHQYRMDVNEFVRVCRGYGKVPILVTPNINPCNPTYPIIGEAKSKRLEKYVSVMRECAKALECDIVDNFYYFNKTARMVSPLTLVPDGAHPSSDAYAMYGRNLAIPLVSAKVLSACYDKAGLCNNTYYDNISTGRSYFLEGGPFNRFDGGLTGSRTAQSTGVNMAVVLDNPTDDNILVMYGPQWTSGTISHLTYNGSDASAAFNGNVNQNVFSSPIAWEGVYVPDVCNMYAGLHVVGLISNSGMGGSGSDFGLCGFGLLPRATVMVSLSNSLQLREYPVICANTEVSFDINLFSSGVVVTLSDCVSSIANLTIDWAGNGLELTATVGASSFTISPSVQSGVYSCKLTFNLDKSVNIVVGVVSVTIPPSSFAFPNMYISTMSMLHSITYT